MTLAEMIKLLRETNNDLSQLLDRMEEREKQIQQQRGDDELHAS
jgi:hypothetical protein